LGKFCLYLFIYLFYYIYIYLFIYWKLERGHSNFNDYTFTGGLLSLKMQQASLSTYKYFLLVVSYQTP